MKLVAQGQVKALLLLGLTGGLFGCAASQAKAPAPRWSTQGVTSAVAATIQNIRFLPASNSTPAQWQCTVKTAGGDLVTVDSDDAASFTPGERVTLLQSPEGARLAHITHEAVSRH